MTQTGILESVGGSVGGIVQPIKARHARISVNQIVCLCVSRPRPYRDFKSTGRVKQTPVDR